jgi:hypothetical protein
MNRYIQLPSSTLELEINPVGVIFLVSRLNLITSSISVWMCYGFHLVSFCSFWL